MALTRTAVVKAIQALPPDEQQLLLKQLRRLRLEGRLGSDPPAEQAVVEDPDEQERVRKEDSDERARVRKETRMREKTAAKEAEARERQIRRDEREAHRQAASIMSGESHPESRRGREAALLRQRAIEAANRAEEAARRLTSKVIDLEATTEAGRTAKEAFERISRELDELRRSYYLSGIDKKIDLRNISEFADVAGMVLDEQRTYLDYDRLYTLWQAASAGPADAPIVEVGTYRGGSAKFIAELLRRAGRAPRFFVCDTFVGSARRAADPQLTSPEGVAAYLADYPNVEIVVGDIQQTTANLPSDAGFGFVHVDVDWYAPINACLEFFAPRLAPGALFVLDDYGFLTCPGAKQAADEYVAGHPEYQLLHLLTGQAVISRRG